MNDREKEFENLVRDIRFDDKPDYNHRDKLEQNLLAALSRQSQHKQPALKIWRIIMKNRIRKVAVAAVVIVAVLLTISVLDKSVTTTYAVEQTIDAIRKVRTVHMAGEFYKQGQFECWMKYAGDPDKPTHIWLGRTGHNMCKICSPEGVFGLNKKTNTVHFASRDERDKAWIIKFGSFFEDAVKKASAGETVEIRSEVCSDNEVHIAIYIRAPKREVKFVVDPDTKLPTSFSTIREDAPMEMMRKTLAVKNLEWIRYNQEPPEGIFEKPAGAKIVDSEVDCMVDPDSGLVADGIAREQACLAIVEQTGKALIDVDVQTALIFL